jgi:NAD(P)-dependent dehydrogenase (short-subunit alcohol dehydrogenase family)
MGKLNNKIVFITGGTSGIGKASAIEAAKEGATVVVANLANAQHEATIQEIAAFDRKTLFVPIDVADANSVKQAISWLASDDASFVTGCAILVDGGYTA